MKRVCKPYQTDEPIMKPSSDFIPQQNSAILSVGDPGSGKTRLAFAFPDPAILDCDGNMTSAVRVSPGKKFWFSQPFQTDDGKEVPVLERWNRATSESLLMLKHAESKSFILDGLSNLCRWGLVHAENQLILGGLNVKKEYLAKYAAFIPLLTNFITQIRLSKKYVYVTVHQVMEKDELSGTIRYILDIPGRLAQNLGGQFTDTWGTFSIADPGSKIGAKYFIKTKPSGYHVNLKTSLDTEPSIDITGKNPQEIWAVLEPKLSINQPITPKPVSTAPVMGTVQQTTQPLVKV